MFGLNWSLFYVNCCCQWVCPCFGSNSEDRGRLFCFGAGPRGCVGQRLVWNILKVGHMRRKVRNIRDNKVVNWVDGQQKILLYFPDCFFFFILFRRWLENCSGIIPSQSFKVRISPRNGCLCPDPKQRSRSHSGRKQGHKL